MRYGFVIDQTRCIGCHACTVACKEENHVPLGVFRTWVKYVEKGEFPNTRRHFAVLRCNHCDDAPCVTICPTVALYRRADGIVDFDRDRCIGCKSCMQACPYDALYIDPDTHTAAKCNFCAHRVERRARARVRHRVPRAGDRRRRPRRPGSEVRAWWRASTSQVRKPEQGTRPKLFYVGADHATLAPALAARAARDDVGAARDRARLAHVPRRRCRVDRRTRDDAEGRRRAGPHGYDVAHEPAALGLARRRLPVDQVDRRRRRDVRRAAACSARASAAV